MFRTPNALEINLNNWRSYLVNDEMLMLSFSTFIRSVSKILVRQSTKFSDSSKSSGSIRLYSIASNILWNQSSMGVKSLFLGMTSILPLASHPNHLRAPT